MSDMLERLWIAFIILVLALTCAAAILLFLTAMVAAMPVAYAWAQVLLRGLMP